MTAFLINGRGTLATLVFICNTNFKRHLKNSRRGATCLLISSETVDRNPSGPSYLYGSNFFILAVPSSNGQMILLNVSPSCIISGLGAALLCSLVQTGKVIISNAGHIHVCDMYYSIRFSRGTYLLFYYITVIDSSKKFCSISRDMPPGAFLPSWLFK